MCDVSLSTRETRPCFSVISTHTCGVAPHALRSFVCQKLMASYHEIASRSCDTYVGEFSCSRSCDRPYPLFCVISGFRVSNSGIFFFTYFCDFYWYDLSIFVHRWIRVSLAGFFEMISRIYASPIFMISIDKFYQYLCIGEFVCHWLLWLTLI